MSDIECIDNDECKCESCLECPENCECDECKIERKISDRYRNAFNTENEWNESDDENESNDLDESDDENESLIPAKYAIDEFVKNKLSCKTCGNLSDSPLTTGCGNVCCNSCYEAWYDSSQLNSELSEICMFCHDRDCRLQQNEFIKKIILNSKYSCICGVTEDFYKMIKHISKCELCGFDDMEI